MTVSSETARNGYTGNDVAVEFAVEFYFFIDADIKAILYNSTTKVETTLTLTTHYTLAGAGDPAGGTLTTVTAPAADETLTILRDLTTTQETDYIEHGKFPADSHERALDRLTMLVQKYVEKTSRTLSFKESSSEIDVEIDDLVANKAIVVNATGTDLEMGPSTDEISSAQTYAIAAETAQTGAETAQTAAELAETNAETAETNAVTAKTAAELAETNAETAETNAVTAKTAAETAETNAVTAKTAAELAETNAVTAKTAAETAQTAAELAETNAETAETNAVTAKIAAELAETNAETAETNAETAQAAAEAAAASLNIAAPVASKQGALLYQNDDDDGYDLLSAQGISGQALQSNGPDAPPSFVESVKTLLTSQGDILYASAANILARLAKGAANTKLFMNAGATAPEWASGVKIGNFTRDISAADGDVGYSGVGFKPSAIILFATINASAASVWGFSTGTANWSADALSGTYYATETYLVTIRKAIGDVSQVSLKTFDEDGFTLTYLKAGTPTGTASIGYLVFR